MGQPESGLFAVLAFAGAALFGYAAAQAGIVFGFAVYAECVIQDAAHAVAAVALAAEGLPPCVARHNPAVVCQIGIGEGFEQRAFGIQQFFAGYAVDAFGGNVVHAFGGTVVEQIADAAVGCIGDAVQQDARVSCEGVADVEFKPAFRIGIGDGRQFYVGFVEIAVVFGKVLAGAVLAVVKIVVGEGG